MFFFLFPYAVARRLSRRPIVVLSLLGANLTVFLLQIALAFNGESGWTLNRFFEVFALHHDPGRFWQWATHMFLHAGPLHLLGNMLLLYLAGAAVEDRIGHLRTALLYVGGGLAAALLQGILGATEAPLVGASGAISALMGAFFILMPWTDFRVAYFYFVLFRIGSGVFLCPALLWLGGYYFLMDVLAGVATLGDEAGGVAHWAHVGGFLSGGGYAAFAYGLSAFSALSDDGDARSMQVERKLRRQMKREQAASKRFGRRPAPDGAPPRESAAQPAAPPPPRTEKARSAADMTEDDALRIRRRARAAIQPDRPPPSSKAPPDETAASQNAEAPYAPRPERNRSTIRPLYGFADTDFDAPAGDAPRKPPAPRLKPTMEVEPFREHLPFVDEDEEPQGGGEHEGGA